MVWPKAMRHGQGWVGIAARGPLSQSETKPVSWNLFLDISGDGPGAIAASSCPGRGGTGTFQTKALK